MFGLNFSHAPEGRRPFLRRALFFISLSLAPVGTTVLSL